VITTGNEGLEKFLSQSAITAMLAAAAKPNEPPDNCPEKDVQAEFGKCLTVFGSITK